MCSKVQADVSDLLSVDDHVLCVRLSIVGELSAEDRLARRDFLKSSREALESSEELFAGGRA